MGIRQENWARKKRDELRIILGGKCVTCGTTKKLEFDVIIPINNNDHHRKLSWDSRMRFYIKQHQHSNLQLLCKYHNGLKGNNPSPF